MIWFFRSLLKVQRKIIVASQQLEYFINHEYRFDVEIFNKTCGKLNDIDKEIFYNLSKVIKIVMLLCISRDNYLILFYYRGI